MRKWAIPLLLLLVLAACASSEGSRAVAVLADGETYLLATDALTVREVLAEAGVTLDEDDRAEPVEPSFVEDGMTIRVIRVGTHTETTQRVLAFERRTVTDESIPSGETRLLEPGEAGLEELTYRVTTEGGALAERTLVRRVVLQEPRTEVVLLGGQENLALTPVAGTVAFIADRNVWLMRTTSANRRRLTHSGDLDGLVFGLSPDASYVLYTRATTDTVSEQRDGSVLPPFNTLWLIETAPGNGAPIRLEVDNILWADWVPGCTGEPTGEDCRIAYSTGTSVPGNPGWRAVNDLWIAQPDPRDGLLAQEQRIVEPSSGGAYGWWGTTYAWSPDGQQLAYARADEIGVIAAHNGTMTSLVRFPPYRTYASWVWSPTLSWSPDGGFLIAALHTPPSSETAPQDSPVFDVWVLAVDGTVKAQLVDEAGMWATPRYASRGDAIVFGQARSPNASQISGYDLYVMDRDGSDSRRLFPQPRDRGLEYPEIAWSPSGDALIAIYRGDLHLITLRDAEATRLTNDGNSTSVDWR